MAGYIAARRIEFDLSTITKLTLYILSPALIIDSLLQTELPAADGLRLAAAFTLSTAVLYGLVVVIAVVGRLPKPVRTSLLATTIFPNTGNLGLSLTLLALGEAGLERAI